MLLHCGLLTDLYVHGFLSCIDVSYLGQILFHVLILEHQNYYRAVQRIL